MSNAIFKFNNGNSALLCSGCSVIMKVGREFNDLEIQAIRGQRHMDAQFCLPCNIKRIFNNRANDTVNDYLNLDVLKRYLTEDQIKEAVKMKYIECDKDVIDETFVSFKLLKF